MRRYTTGISNAKERRGFEKEKVPAGPKTKTPATAEEMMPVVVDEDGNEAGAYTRSPSKLNLKTFGNTSPLLELNLSTFRPRPRVNWVT